MIWQISVLACEFIYTTPPSGRFSCHSVQDNDPTQHYTLQSTAQQSQQLQKTKRTQIYVNLLFKEMINSLLFANTNKSSNFSWTLNAQHPHELWTKEASPTVFLIRISPGTTARTIASVCVRVSLGVLGVGCLLVGLICLMMKIPGTQGTWWGGERVLKRGVALLSCTNAITTVARHWSQQRSQTLSLSLSLALSLLHTLPLSLSDTRTHRLAH